MNKEQYNDTLGQLIQLATDLELQFTITEHGMSINLPRPIQEPQVITHIDTPTLENEDDN